jgi:hypothetical protein
MTGQIEELRDCLYKLESYIVSESYKGYDPFDGLMSPLFRLPLLRNNKLTRFVFQQVFRRIPINIRPLLGIQKGLNPVTLGLTIQAYTFLIQLNKEKEKFYNKQIDSCINNLIELKSRNYSGACWGYDFDWEGRYAKIPAYYPTIVATGIIANSLFEYYRYSNDIRAKELIISAAQFTLNDLNRNNEGNQLSLSYSPNDNQIVFNASMKGARLLSQAYNLTNDVKFIEVAESIVKYVVDNQNKDGSWPYSKGDARNWVDNFHTAYILDALNEFINLSGKNEYRVYLERGKKFYIENLFTVEGYPKYYKNSFYPIDSTEVAQSILTLANFKYLDKANIVLKFAIKELYSGKGYFYYQKHKSYINTISFMRWTNAWMLVALSKLLFDLNAEKYKVQ